MGRNGFLARELAHHYTAQPYAQGATWFRRGLQNLWCMPRCGVPRKSIRKLIVANDDNYALAA